MNNTERKLDEAKFFLDKLQVDKPYFDYYLSAYLNSARSISWVMRNEFQKIVGWEQWFQNVEINVLEKMLLKKINDLRIKSAKQSGVQTNYYFLDGILTDEKFFPEIEEMLTKLDGEEVLITIYEKEEYEKEKHTLEKNDEAEGKKYVIEGISEKKDIEAETSRESILKLCKEYFNFMNLQVVNCTTRFS